MAHKIIKTDNYLFVLEHSRIKRGDTVKYDNGYFTATHDNYHDSLMKIIAHLPLNGSPILEGVDLLPPYSRHQEDGLDEFELFLNREVEFNLCPKDIIERIKWYYQTYFKPKEKYKYTEEDMRKAIDMATTSKHDSTLILFNAEEIIQYLHQYPTEFECEMEIIGVTDDGISTIEEIKTITTAKGVQWVGKYK
jgi:hypothetical protein